MMKARIRLALLDGKYLCPYRYPDEYACLAEQESERTAVNQWLNEIEMRLARLGDDGAFFMAPQQIQAHDLARIRDEFARFRDVYGPLVHMLDMLRNAQEEFSFQPGEYLQLADLVLSVNGSATLEGQLRSFEISGTHKRYSNHELLKRMLDNLSKEGYLILSNPERHVYRCTGKLQQLSLALEYMAERQGLINSTNEHETHEQSELLDALYVDDEAESI